MALLRDLKVNKVSFVDKAANKRKFLLLKSADADTDANAGAEPTTKTEGESNIMLREEIQKSVRLLLKGGLDDNKIIETVKSEFKTTDAENAELTANLALVRSLVPPAPEPPPPAADATTSELAKMRQENEVLRADIRKDAEDRKKGEIRLWLSENCSHLTADANQMVDDIFKMQSANPEGVDRFKASLKASSDAIKNSALFVEKGSSYDSVPVPMGSTIMKKVKESIEEVRKSGNPISKGSDVVMQAVKSLGADAYKRYRDEHNYRAKHSV
jgi:hypothetical protein